MGASSIARLELQEYGLSGSATSPDLCDFQPPAPRSGCPAVLRVHGPTHDAPRPDSPLQSAWVVLDEHRQPVRADVAERRTGVNDGSRSGPGLHERRLYGSPTRPAGFGQRIQRIGWPDPTRCCCSPICPEAADRACRRVRRAGRQARDARVNAEPGLSGLFTDHSVRRGLELPSH